MIPIVRTFCQVETYNHLLHPAAVLDSHISGIFLINIHRSNRFCYYVRYVPVGGNNLCQVSNAHTPAGPQLPRSLSSYGGISLSCYFLSSRIWHYYKPSIFPLKDLCNKLILPAPSHYPHTFLEDPRDPYNLLTYGILKSQFDIIGQSFHISPCLSTPVNPRLVITCECYRNNHFR